MKKKKNGRNLTAEMEIESLKSIYPDECQVRGNEKGMYVVSMFIPAVFGRDSHASANILIKIPLAYPKEEPIIIVEETKGLSDDDELQLKRDIMKKSKELVSKEDIFLFDIILYTQEFLQAHNDSEIELSKVQKKLTLARSDSTVSKTISKDFDDIYNANNDYKDYRGRIQQLRLSDNTHLFNESDDLINKLGDGTDMRTDSIDSEKELSPLDNVAEIPSNASFDEQRKGVTSRFKSDFIVNKVIGRGGFGVIMLCTNKWDNMQYAVKVIQLDDNEVENRKLLREVRMLALMKNKYIVRYNSCWIEIDDHVEAEKDIIDDEDDYKLDEDSFTWGKESFHISMYKEKSEGLLKGLIFPQDDLNGLSYQDNSQLERISEGAFDFVDDKNTESSYSDSSDSSYSDSSDSSYSDSSDSSYSDSSESFFTSESVSSSSQSQSQSFKTKETSTESIIIEDSSSQPLTTDESTGNCMVTEESSIYPTSTEEISLRSTPVDENEEHCPVLSDTSLSLLSSKEGLQTHRKLFIQMEYYKNGTLEDLIKTGNLYKDKVSIWKILSNLLNGLQYVHKLNIVHRDLKPSNIFFDDEGIARIGDFGLGYFASKDIPFVPDELSPSNDPNNENTSPAGTLMYAPPEQQSNQSMYRNRKCEKPHITTKADMFCLGLILYEMLLPPMKTALEKTQVMQNARVGILDPSVKGSIYEKIILHCLEYDPNKRPSVETVMENLMMENGDMTLTKESLDAVLPYVQRTDNYIFPTIIKCLLNREPTYAEMVGFYSELLNGEGNTTFIYDLMCKRQERKRVCNEIEQCLTLVINRFGYQYFESPLIVPETPYFHYLYPLQYPILDSFGTPCFIRSDLRTSFLSYMMRTPNTRIRRYEFGNVMRLSREGSKSATQYCGSIDTIWQYKPYQNNISLAYTWEAIILSCNLLKPLSILLHRPLQLHINHVGIISTILEQYDIKDIIEQKQIVDKLRGILKMQLASLNSTKKLSYSESVKAHRFIIESQIASILHIDESEAMILRKLLFLDSKPSLWIKGVHETIDELIEYRKDKMTNKDKEFLYTCLYEMEEIVGVMQKYSFTETAERLVFDIFLMPQGRDQNYGIYYACLVTDKRQPYIVSSSNPSAVKQEGHDRYIIVDPRNTKTEMDYVILYGGRFDRELCKYSTNDIRPFFLRHGTTCKIGIMNISLHMENITSLMLNYKHTLLLKKASSTASITPTILVVCNTEKKSGLFDLYICDLCWKEKYQCTWWDKNKRSISQSYHNYCIDNHIEFIIQHNGTVENVSLFHFDEKKKSFYRASSGVLTSILNDIHLISSNDLHISSRKQSYEAETKKDITVPVPTGIINENIIQYEKKSDNHVDFVFLNAETRKKENCEISVRETLIKSGVKSSAYVIMIMSKISKVRELVSLILANESITNYLPKSTALEIQHIVKEKKKECLIFYSLGDNMFDIVYLSMLHDVSSITEESKKKCK